ncbi:ShlB/FhaC/HecB family hemolysin secretion/activation protein, partial [Kaarinaea lacus]
ALLNFSFYNLAGAKDHFFGNLYKTFDPDNGLYGVLNYELPVVTNKNLLGVNVSRNEFKMDRTTSSIEAKGDTTIGSLYVRHTLKRSRRSNHYTGLTFARKRSEVEIVGTPTRDDLAVLTLDYQFDALDPRTAGVNLGYIRYSHGFDGILGIPSDDENDQLFKLSADSTAKFDKVELGYTRLQSLNPANSLMVTARGQFTNDILASLEQMSLGGPDSVRAYPVAQYLRDQAYFGSLEWILRAPGASELPVFDNKTLGDVMQLSIYFDIAGGALNKKDSDDSESVTIKGLGVGLTLNIFSFSTRIDVAKPVDVKSEEEDLGVQTYFNAAYRF